MTSQTSLTSDQAPLVALVHKQLAALESLATDGHTEAAALRAEIAALAGQLNGAVARLARLEATLQSHAQLLAAIGAGLMQLPAAAPAAERAARTPASESATPPQPQAQPVAQSQPTSAAAAPSRPTAAERAAAPAAVAPAPTQAPPMAQSQPKPAPASAPLAQPQPTTVERTSATTPVPPTAAPQPATATPATLPPQAQPVAQSQPAPEPAAPSGPQVQRGSRVRVVFDDDTTETYTIVRQEETNRQRNLIGENSPLGAALLGAIVGELRAFRVRPAGPEQMVEVLAIEG